MNNEFRLNQLSNGLEFLGKLLMASNGNRHGRNGLTGDDAEQCGNLLLVLSDYAAMIDRDTRG